MPRLAEIKKENGGQVPAPYHLINVAVNLPSSKEPELRGRRSDFFVLSSCWCGSPLTGYVPTSTLEKYDRGMDLATAMAASGAALSSRMGMLQRPGVAPILALLNANLGYWAANPGALSLRWASWYHRFREATGWCMDERKSHVFLSDGGHIENLGIYELLRRRCKLIIAVDGEADPTAHCAALVKVMRLASIDLGVSIDIWLSEIPKDEHGLSRSHFALGTIDYGNGERGYLLFLKLSVTGDEPAIIQDYRRRHPSFPHESTVNQFFAEDQFEAYRALGEHIGKDLFQPELFGPPLDFGKLSTRQWLEELVKELLAGDDTAEPSEEDRS